MLRAHFKKWLLATVTFSLGLPLPLSADLSEVKDELAHHAVATVLPQGTEGYVLTAFDLGRGEFLALIRLLGPELPNGVQIRKVASALSSKAPDASGSHAHEVWIVDRLDRPNFNYYMLVDSLSRQTVEAPLDSKKEYFVHAIEATTGYVDLGHVVEFLKRQKKWEGVRDSCFQPLVQQNRYFPISNLAKREAPRRRPEPACPRIPKDKDGSKCSITDPIDLSRSQKLREYLIAAEGATQVDAALLAAIITQESRFDPFAINQEELKACKDPAKPETCPKYGYSKGIAQIGTQKAGEYGLNWFVDPPSLPECRGSFTSDDCMIAFERYCKANTRKGRAPVFCPKEAILALAKYVSEILGKNRESRVWIHDEDGSFALRLQDLKTVIHSNRANEFRYAAGEYNRGPMVDNSIEEYFRQTGEEPKDYGEVWAIRRGQDTPSNAIGFQILNREYINRCYVWNVAGLCGDHFPGRSLAGHYDRFFKK